MKNVMAVFVCILCLTGCTTQAPQIHSSQAATADSASINSSSKDEAQEPLQAYNLADVGYRIDFSSTALSDTDGNSLSVYEQPKDLFFEEEMENIRLGPFFGSGTYGSKVLVGSYTVIQPFLFQGYTQDNGVAIAVLQAFRQEDIEKGANTVRFCSTPAQFDSQGHETTYTIKLSELEPFKVFCNDEIVVYNFTNQLGNLSVEGQLLLPEVGVSSGSEQYKTILHFGELLSQLTLEEWKTVIAPHMHSK